MSLDRMKHLVNSDSFYLLGLCCDFNKHLGVNVIAVLAHKLSQVPQQLKDIDALLKLLSRQMALYDVHLELFLRQDSHVLIGLEVMGSQSRHLVENLA